ncbi:FecR domain-containing protein [Parabacteroides sp. OttesenSCG-928-K15]|nr:FecR domain-containing protein [Parabacteroides sp. OttesenSCG-928-K15]
MDELMLIRYAKNELTEAEREKVEKWIDASPENKKIADDCFYLSWAISTLYNMKRSMPEAALQRVDKRLSKNKSRSVFWYLQRIAAILIIPIMLLAGYMLMRSQEKQPVCYLEARMTPGMIGSMSLPDGTKVWLNSSSSIKYPMKFVGDEREIYLDGEAFFQVEKDVEKPFIVQTKQSSITVLGTAFNVDAYSFNPVVTTTLVEGSVEFSYKDEYNKTKSFLLAPNEQIAYHVETGKATSQETYVPKDIAWKNGQIILRDTPLTEVLWILSKRFNVDFVIKDPAFYKHSFTGVFTNQQIERVLEHFKRSSEINYKIDHQLDNDGEIVRSRVELF